MRKFCVFPPTAEYSYSPHVPCEKTLCLCGKVASKQTTIIRINGINAYASGNKMQEGKVLKTAAVLKTGVCRIS